MISLSPKKSLQIRNKIDDLATAIEETEAWMAARAASPEAIQFVLLVIEELVTNCIKYGYDDTADHIISFELNFENGAIAMKVEDDGHPFNPLEAPPADTTSAIEDRETGGLGLHLIRELGDQISYRRLGGFNQLILKKVCQY